MHRDLDFSQAAALAVPEQKPAIKAPWHLYVISSTAVLWNALGIFDFLATLTRFTPYMERFPEAARDYLAALPVWVFAIWAVAIFSALAGSLLLLRRQVLAVRVLAVSATATIFSMAATYTRPSVEGDFDRVSAVFIIVIALLMLNYAFHMAKRGVLR